MDSRGVGLAEAALGLGVSHQTVAHWRSQGVPARRLAQVGYWMAQRDRGGEVGARRTLVIDATREQFTTWNQAASAEGRLIEDWAREGLDDLAREALETGELKELPPVQNTGQEAS